MGPKFGLSRHDDFITDGNIVLELRVIKMADANTVAALLDGRILLDPLYLFFPIAPEPVSGLDVPGHLNLIGAPGVYLDTA